MSIIKPDERLILITGINSETFLKGYDSKDCSFDKRLTPMARQSIYAMPLSSDRAQAVFYDREPVCLSTDWEDMDDVTFNDELSLHDTIHFAYRWAELHGGDMLLLMMKHPELMIDGINYEIEERGGDYVINPGKVKLEKIMRATDIKPDKQGIGLESVIFEDATLSIGNNY